MTIKTVGDLRRALSEFSDDIKLVIQNIDFEHVKKPELEVDRVIVSEWYDGVTRLYFSKQGKEEADSEEYPIKKLEHPVCLIDLSLFEEV